MTKIDVYPGCIEDTDSPHTLYSGSAPPSIVIGALYLEDDKKKASMMHGIIDFDDFQESVNSFLDRLQSKSGLQLYIIGGKYTEGSDEYSLRLVDDPKKIKKARTLVAESIVQKGLSEKLAVLRWDPIDAYQALTLSPKEYKGTVEKFKLSSPEYGLFTEDRRTSDSIDKLLI